MENLVIYLRVLTIKIAEPKQCAKNYILGFSDEIKIEKHNLRQADSLRLIEDGRLEDYLDKEFPR